MFSPDIDGGWAWLVLASSFILHILAYGLSWSSGIYNAVFLDEFGQSKAATAWAVGLPTAVMYTVAPLSSMLTNKFGFRFVIIGGGVIVLAGQCLSFFAPNLYYLYFTFGLLSGAGFGIIYIPSIAAISYYFDKKLTLAAGIAASGIGVGNFIYPPLIRWLINEYDWKQSFLLLGATSLNACVCGAVMRPIKRHEVRNDQPVLDLTPFKVSGYVTLCVNNLLFCCGITTMYLHLPVLSERKGTTADLSAILISVLGAANLFGRLGSGLVGSHSRVNVFVLYGVSLFLSGVCIFIVPFVDSFAGLVCCSLLFGLFSGSFGTLLVPILMQLLGLQRFANGYGCLLLFEASGQLIGGPLTGAMFDLTQAYTLTFVTGGVLCMASAVIMVQPYYYVKHLSEASSKPEITSEEEIAIDVSNDMDKVKYPSHRDIVQMTVSMESLVAARRIYEIQRSTQSLNVPHGPNQDTSLLQNVFKKRKKTGLSRSTEAM